MDLTGFLLARIGEDEALAQSAAEDENLLRSLRNITSAPIPGGEILHIVRWDPARVLAECEAKKRIVEGYLLRLEQSEHPGGEVFGYHATGMGVALKLLAAVYADHPDYRQGWRP